jgi:hypothetical protein
MSAQDWTAAWHMRHIANFRTPLIASAAIAAVALASACSIDPPPGPVAGRDPSDPRARVPAVSYRSTVAPYESLRPVEPAPWIQQNQQIAPQPKR